MTDEPRTEDAPAPSGSLEERLAKVESDAQKYLDNWRRAEADFQNFKKRSEQERDELRRFSSGALIINLLPIVDDFERAFGSIDASLAGLTWLDGMRLIYRKLLALLEASGVRPIEAEGQKFDPRVHEAVAHVDGEENKVLSEVQRGYMLHDRVLRPAMVVVGRGGGSSEQEGGSQM
jgi:molecular chaperone GrpE